jgi:hypothetical protein
MGSMNSVSTSRGFGNPETETRDLPISIRRFASKFDQVTGIHVTVTDNTGDFVGNED